MSAALNRSGSWICGVARLGEVDQFRAGNGGLRLLRQLRVMAETRGGGGPPVNGVLSFFTTRISSRPSIRSAMGRWSIRISLAEGLRCSSAAPTQTRKRPSPKSAISSAGTPRTWARSRRRARSNRCACCGASPAPVKATGRRTPSSCCANRDCGVRRRDAPLRRACSASSWLLRFFSACAAASGLRRGVEHSAQFLRDFSLRVGLGQKLHARVKPPVMNDGASGIACREKHRQSRA